jgi:hypothetical protein
MSRFVRIERDKKKPKHWRHERMAQMINQSIVVNLIPKNKNKKNMSFSMKAS